MKFFHIIVLILVILLIALIFVYEFGFYFKEPVVNSENRVEIIEIKGNILNVDVVESAKDRTTGLSGRKSLESNYGMFFIFPEDDFHSIWMKNMNFPIDIIWIDSNFKIVYIKNDATPESFPEIFKTNVKSRYVLEIASGYSNIFDIKIGDEIKFSENVLIKPATSE